MGEILRTLFPGRSLASPLLLRRYGFLLLLLLCLFLLFFLNLTGALKNGLPGKELWEEASRHTRKLAGESGWGGGICPSSSSSSFSLGGISGIRRRRGGRRDNLLSSKRGGKKKLHGGGGTESPPPPPPPSLQLAFQRERGILCCPWANPAPPTFNLCSEQSGPHTSKCVREGGKGVRMRKRRRNNNINTSSSPLLPPWAMRSRRQLPEIFFSRGHVCMRWMGGGLGRED